MPIRITEEKFRAYENIRRSGKTNMFDIKKVIKLSKGFLYEWEVVYIIGHYSELAKVYS